MYASIRDTRIYFDVDGVGLIPDGPAMRQRPTAFLIHGGPGVDHSGFKKSFGRFTERLQLVYLDQRGCGRSSREAPERYTLDENVEDIEALRRYLGLEKIVSVGTSYGGMVAMAHAARYPDSVSDLALIVTAHHSGLVSRAREIVNERGTPEQIAGAELLFAGRVDTDEKFRDFLQLLDPLYTYRSGAGDAVGYIHTILSAAPLVQAWSPGGTFHTFDLRAELPRITAKTTIIAGRHDWITAPEFSEDMHRLIPGSDLEIFEDSAHSLWIDEPERFMDALDRFLPR